MLFVQYNAGKVMACTKIQYMYTENLRTALQGRMLKYNDVFVIFFWGTGCVGEEKQD